MTHRVLLVGGDFSENPRPSGYVRKLHEELSKLGLFQIMYHNGGSIAVLEGYVQKANGFVDKNEQNPAVLSQAILAVLAGQVHYAPIVNESSAKIRRDPKAFIRVLSDYQTQILTMIGASQTDQEIAAALGISATTVQSRRRDIMRNLGIHSTPKLIHYALVNGLTRAEQLVPLRPD